MIMAELNSLSKYDFDFALQFSIEKKFNYA